MLDIKLIRENPKKVQDGAASKNVKINIDELLELDDMRRKTLHEIEELKAKMNILSKKVGESKGKDKESIKESQAVKEKIKAIEPKLDQIETDFNKMMRLVPNMPLADVRIGKDERDNKVLRKVGKPKKFSAKGGSASGGKVLDYMELGEKLDIIDTKRAGKVSGTRFGYIKGKLALLEFALARYVFDTLAKEKFVPIIPPVMILEDSMNAMGYADRSADEIYHFPEDKLYLVGTSEQSVIPMHKDEVFSENDFPKRYVAFSTCFRREAGSYGKDTKGILRVHQFDKLEMLSFVKPKDSEKEHKLLLSLEEKLMKGLKLPYQVLNICSGDLGDPAAKKYDIEVWIPSEQKYRETHSTSNCTDFQARRLNIRYKTKDNQMAFVHTLNGTAFAIGRILIAIIENGQQRDGSIKIPAVLKKYCGFEKIK